LVNPQIRDQGGYYMNGTKLKVVPVYDQSIMNKDHYGIKTTNKKKETGDGTFDSLLKTEIEKLKSNK
jgi:hypothetical protein